MTTLKCAICKREGDEAKMVKYVSPDGLVSFYHPGGCLDLHIKWQMFEEEE